jgi:hypothetical protein
MKKLKKFPNKSYYEQWLDDAISNEDDVFPLVAYIADTKETIINPGYDVLPLTIEMLENGWLNIINNNSVYIYYSKNYGSWDNIYRTSASIEVNKGDKIRVRSTLNNTNGRTYITSSAKHKVYGCLASLYYNDAFLGKNGGAYDGWFQQDTGLIDAENLILPLNANLEYLFLGCVNLVTAPKSINLSGDTRVWGMFSNCLALEKAPLIDFSGKYTEFNLGQSPKIKRVDVKNLEYNEGHCGNVFNTTKLNYVICNQSEGSSVMPPVFLNNIKSNIPEYELEYSKSQSNTNVYMYCDDFFGGLVYGEGFNSLEEWFNEYGQYGRRYKLVGDIEIDQDWGLLWELANPAFSGEEQLCTATYLVTDGHLSLNNLSDVCDANFNAIDLALYNEEDPDVSHLTNPFIAVLGSDLQDSYDVDEYFGWHCIPYVMEGV